MVLCACLGQFFFYVLNFFLPSTSSQMIASIAFVATLALVHCRPQARPQAPSNTPIPIISFVNEPAVDGTYKYA